MTDVAKVVSERLASESYASEEVRRHLEKLARLLVDSHTPDVNLIAVDKGRCRKEGDSLAIDITDKEIEQTRTNLSEDAWQLLAREAILIHEVGHVLYTDFDELEEVEDKLEMGERKRFHRIQNAIEDAAINQQLRWKFNCGDELDITYANIFGGARHRLHGLPFLDAVDTAILEKGVYSIGVLEEYQEGSRQLVAPSQEDEFEEALDLVDGVLADTMSEPDPRKRYDRILEFWGDLRELLPASSMRSSGEGLSDEVPDDSEGVGDGRQAGELEDVDREDVKKVVTTVGGGPDEDEDGEGEEGEGSEDGDFHEADGEPGGEPDEDETGSSGSGEETDGEDAGSDGEGGGSPGGSGYPGHEGHNLVIKD